MTGHGRRGTQHYNEGYDVHRAPCESHDNLSEDVADAATSHIPRLTEVKRACVLRDVRDSQGAPSPALLSWRSHSDDWLLQLSASFAANSWSAARNLCVSATSFLRLPTSTARLPCRVSFCLDRCCQRGNSSFFATMSPAWLALRSSSSFWAATNCFRMPMISPLCGAYP